jgi:ribonuclease VapC
MNYIIDASALLAVLQKETGYLTVVPLLMGAFMSTVNLAEVLQKAEQKALKIPNLMDSLLGLGIEMVPFTTEQAELAATLWTTTSSLGLSLGDRACLALAQSRGAIALTADRSWAKISSLQVQVIR